MHLSACSRTPASAKEISARWYPSTRRRRRKKRIQSSRTRERRSCVRRRAVMECGGAETGGWDEGLVEGGRGDEAEAEKEEEQVEVEVEVLVSDSPYVLRARYAAERSF